MPDVDISNMVKGDLSDSMEDPVLLGIFAVSCEYWKLDIPEVALSDALPDDPLTDEAFAEEPSLLTRSFRFKLEVGVLLLDEAESDLLDPALPSGILGCCKDTMIFTMLRCFFIMCSANCCLCEVWNPHHSQLKPPLDWGLIIDSSTLRSISSGDSSHCSSMDEASESKSSAPAGGAEWPGRPSLWCIFWCFRIRALCGDL